MSSSNTETQEMPTSSSSTPTQVPTPPTTLIITKQKYPRRVAMSRQ